MKLQTSLFLTAALALSLASCGSNKQKDAAAAEGDTAKAAQATTQTVDVDGHKFVDLGLPSGLLWAETNIGAETAADAGEFFAWGETAPKKDYTWDTYKFGNADLNEYENVTKNHFNKYTGKDDKAVLDKEDDAATVNWGSSCRMPTEEEIDELGNEEYVERKWDVRKNSKGEDVHGYVLTSKKNGNSIFLPAAGSYTKSMVIGADYAGNYWSTTLSSQEDYSLSVYLSIKENNTFNSSYDGKRCTGCNVRPVAKKQ